MTNKLTIIGSLTSPFVRIVRAMCEELQLPYEMDLTVFFGKQNEGQKQHISNHNPLMRVPVLVDGEQEILDSRIILGHLLKHPEAKPLADFRTAFPIDINEENRLSVIYGVIDAGVLCFILRNLHPEIKPDTGYLVQSQRRIEQGLKWLDADEALGSSFGIPELALICGLEWGAKRETIDWQDFKRLQTIHEQFKDRPSLFKTRIPETA